MNAVVVERPGKVGVQRIDDPTPGRREVLVRVEACGICGTDLHILDGELPPTRYPIVPGHEFCGEVVAAGHQVERLRVGDFVAVDPNLYCGECPFCQAGRNNLCQNYEAIGVTRAGACAELVVAPAANAFVLPGDLPRAWGTLVEPLSCAVHGFDRLGAKLGDRYLIYGAGTMGLLMAQLARRAGAATVDVVDVKESRLPVAKRLGADRTATSADELERPQGWEVVIDATGVVGAIEDGLRRVARGGTFLMFGVTAAEATATFSPFRIYNEEINVIGSMAVLHSFERARDLLVGGAIDAAAMITHNMALESYEAAIAAFRTGAGLKIQVTPTTDGQTR
ncbi:MAG TPA: zinc-dependent alcohol dehydrogenase family protein [Actinomycetes bacterium]|nr:zinc-dependent alcohol dehydrogenase family protein [Actinomycetes bacterium]